MKAETLIGAVTFIAITAVLACSAIALERHEKAEEERRSSAIGCRVAIDGDSLTVIRWSSGPIGVPRGFYLSNGATIDEDLCYKLAGL